MNSGRCTTDKKSSLRSGGGMEPKCAREAESGSNKPKCLMCVCGFNAVCLSADSPKDDFSKYTFKWPHFLLLWKGNRMDVILTFCHAGTNVCSNFPFQRWSCIHNLTNTLGPITGKGKSRPHAHSHKWFSAVQQSAEMESTTAADTDLPLAQSPSDYLPCPSPYTYRLWYKYTVYCGE